MTAKPKKTTLPAPECPLFAVTETTVEIKKSQYFASLERRRAGIELILSANKKLIPSDEEFGLESTINSVEIGNNHHVTPEENFSLLCVAAAKAFPSMSPTDAEIHGNAATPHLIRYVLDAFKRYEQTKNIHTAFNLKKQKRGPRDTFKELSSEMARAATICYIEAQNQKASPAEAFKCAEDAAYKRLREGHDDIQEDRLMRKTKSRIRVLISQLLSVSN